VCDVAALLGRPDEIDYGRIGEVEQRAVRRDIVVTLLQRVPSL
jgi:hypothetical protein